MASRASMIAALLLFPLLFSCSVEGGRRSHHHGHSKGKRGPPAGLVGGTKFNVLSFGAKPGSKVDNSEAFIRAWTTACNFGGKAVVLVPPGVYKLGEIIFNGPCKSRTPITFQLDGILQAVSDVSGYSGTGWISFTHLNGLILTGRGTIDGQGQAVWEYNDCKTNADCVHLPATLYMNKANNTIINSINLINSMGFQMHITNSEQVRINSITITAPEESPNTDGIHISRSDMVEISRSLIRTGDDCISIGQGSTNITIDQITCGPGHGISVGSLGKVENEADVKGVRVKNCTLNGTSNGLRIKTYPASDPSKASGMVFQDIILNNVDNPIVINQNYGRRKSSKPSLVKITDVLFQNIRGTSQTPVPVSLMCSSGAPCENVRFHNIDLRFFGKDVPTAECANAKVAYTGAQNPGPCLVRRN